VYPWVGREIPVGGENLNGPFGVWRVSVAGLKFRDPENAIYLSAAVGVRPIGRGKEIKKEDRSRERRVEDREV
jgi:hypothetical protein